MSEPVIRIEHVQEAKRRHGGYCTRGIGKWLARHGLSLREFLRNGYPVGIIEKLGDPFGNTVASIAREQAKGGV